MKNNKLHKKIKIEEAPLPNKTAAD